jgi:hypothetical protein
MARHINQLPSEVLRSILLAVKENSGAAHDGSFIDALTVCSLWREIGEQILYTDVSLSTEPLHPVRKSSGPVSSVRNPRRSTNKVRSKRELTGTEQPPLNTSLAKFIVASRRFDTVKMVRSLTITTGTLEYSFYHGMSNWPKSVGISIKKEGFRAHTFSGEAVLWCLLQALPSTIREMEHLESFSLNIRGSHVWSVEPKQIRAIVDALPPSLRNLDLDTGCARHMRLSTDKPAKPVHICRSIRRIVPRLHNLRLRLGQICEDLIPLSCPESACRGGVPSEQEGGRTLIINMADRTLQSRPTRCGAENTDALDGYADWKDTEDLIERLVSAMETGLETNGLKSYRHCAVVSARMSSIGTNELGDMEFDTIFKTEVCRPRQQLKFPICRPRYYQLLGVPIWVKGDEPWSSTWCQDKTGEPYAMRITAPSGKEMEVHGRADDLLRNAEGEIWVTTEGKVRVAESYFQSRPRFAEAQAIEDNLRQLENLEYKVQSAMQANDVLRKMEVESGRWLLHASNTNDLTDFALVRRDLSRRETHRLDREKARELGAEIPHDEYLDRSNDSTTGPEPEAEMHDDEEESHEEDRNGPENFGYGSGDSSYEDDSEREFEDEADEFHESGNYGYGSRDYSDQLA